MNKKEIRKSILEKRDALPEKSRKSYSDTITKCVLAQDEVKNANVIFAFVSFGSEVETHELLEELLRLGKTVYIPVTKKGVPTMRLAQLTSMDDLEIGHYGILSPKADHLHWGEEALVETVLVPGVAFDKYGYRIGYGAGFYDRFFAGITHHVNKIGLGFSLQSVEEVPTDQYDIPVDRFISEVGIYHSIQRS